MGTIGTLFCKLGPQEVQGQSAELSETDFSEGSILIGRNPNLAIPIPDDQVSRLHCSLTYKDDSFFIADQDSTNGSFLNGEKLEPLKSYRLRHEDEIQLGFTIFTFKLAQPNHALHPERGLARELLRSHGWQVVRPKGAKYWVVPATQSLNKTDPDSAASIQQAFATSASIGLPLEKHAGKRALMEKYQVTSPSRNDFEAYVLFLNGRIIGAYAVSSESPDKLLPLNSVSQITHYNLPGNSGGRYNSAEF